jgi:hypothetical protein
LGIEFKDNEILISYNKVEGLEEVKQQIKGELPYYLKYFIS